MNFGISYFCNFHFFPFDVFGLGMTLMCSRMIVHLFYCATDIAPVMQHIIKYSASCFHWLLWRERGHLNWPWQVIWTSVWVLWRSCCWIDCCFTGSFLLVVHQDHHLYSSLETLSNVFTLYGEFVRDEVEVSSKEYWLTVFGCPSHTPCALLIHRRTITDHVNCIDGFIESLLIFLI